LNESIALLATTYRKCDGYLRKVMLRGTQHTRLFARRTFSSFQPRKQIIVDMPVSKELEKRRSNGFLLGSVLVGAGAMYFYLSPPKHAGGPVYDQVVRRRVQSAYSYALGGVTLTAISAAGFYKMGFPAILARTSPWAHLGISLATTIPLLMGIIAVPYNEERLLKHVLWGGFIVTTAGTLCTMGVLGGPILSQAALATGCMMGGLSLLASKTDPGRLDSFEGPLGVGLGVMVAAAMGNMFFPLPLLHNVALYGGLAVFGGLTLTDTKRMLWRAQTAPAYDPINESLGLYLNAINIFVRMAEIMAQLDDSRNRRH
jgi:FtsH-binding integral membrane protein